MKPEIAFSLYQPLWETIKETVVPAEKWPFKTDPQGNEWIDEATFRQLIAVLVNDGGKDRLVHAGRKVWASDALGFGSLLLPFFSEPQELFTELVEQVNQRSRTFRLSFEQEGRQRFVLRMDIAERHANSLLLELWLEGILAAVAATQFRLQSARREQLTSDDPVAQTWFICPLANERSVTLQERSCSYEIVWKRPWFGRQPAGRANQAAIREALAKTRELVTGQATRLEQSQVRLAQQEELLQGIVALSEASKSVRSLQDLLNIIATRICSDFGFDRSQIYLARDDELAIAAVIDPTDPSWAQQIYAVCQSNPIKLDGRTEESRAFQTGKPAVINNPWGNMFVPQPQMKAWKSKAYLIVPMRGADHMIGLLLADYYHKRQTIQTEDANKLMAVANIAGLAIDKLGLIDRLEAKVTERTHELQRANKKLIQLYEKARETDRLKSEFLANMSHELRTPLNSIIGFSKILLKGIDGALTSQQETDLTAILNSGTHLLGLINDILDLSKIESGRMELFKEQFDLNEVITQVATTGEGLIKEKPLKIVTQLETQLPTVYADKIRIKQVLLNLVSNAIKFSEKGQITLSSKADRSLFYVAVTDCGVGIPQDKIEKAFEQFQQLDSGTARAQGGTGLGLTISKKFVEMHNGRIWVTSTEGVGSTFHIAIPLIQDPAAVNTTTKAKTG